MQLDNSSQLKEREFLLFSDCLIWLANERMIEAEWLHKRDSLEGPSAWNPGKRPEFKRTRSRSENEVPDIAKRRRRPGFGGPTKSGLGSAGIEEKWWFKGKVDLIDCEVVLNASRERDDKRRLDILNPEMSFSMYADTEVLRDDWVADIRGAKASLLVSLNVMHPNSTLTSSTSNNHIRRSLQALPYLPEGEENQGQPRRGRVDHFVPAVWVPDGKTGACMRCGKSFSWRRRRHHCRLCGRCVCSGCSERVSVISAISDYSHSERQSIDILYFRSECKGS
jgi:FYVE, RhoGEF and PH domain containing 5/6